MPLVVYDSKNGRLPALVISPLTNPKAQHFTSDADTFGAGVKSSVTSIPSGWTQTFILSAGFGINDATMKWGDHVLAFTNKTRPDFYLDQTHSTIGFWTDNGGYYHYSTGTDKKKTYEEVGNNTMN